MSGIVLSAATRQSLLSAQDTASLLATTQTRLSTGKKVNSALDNPLNYFTAASLDSRASDLSNLLDGISNGIQTINAASTGISNIQKLVDSAKSTANQALATTVTTTGTASSAYAAATTGQNIAFQVNGSAKTFTLAANATIDTAISGLNTAAGTSIFAKSADGTKIVVNGSGIVQISGSTSLTALGFSAVGSDVASTTWYDESSNSTDLTVNGLDTRANLAKQYNDLLSQIDQLASDASYNGVDLINSNSGANKLKIQFNADNTSSVSVQGVDATSSGIGLATIASTSAASFTKDTDISTALTSLTAATTKLRTYSSQLGSNLTIVQNRQDFTKNLINTLQTGSANLTNADLNEEAANSQALSTRQSLAISALSLANTAQQNVLQLLR